MHLSVICVRQRLREDVPVLLVYHDIRFESYHNHPGEPFRSPDHLWKNTVVVTCFTFEPLRTVRNSFLSNHSAISVKRNLETFKRMIK